MSTVKDQLIGKIKVAFMLRDSEELVRITLLDQDEAWLMLEEPSRDIFVTKFSYSSGAKAITLEELKDTELMAFYAKISDSYLPKAQVASLVNDEFIKTELSNTTWITGYEGPPYMLVADPETGKAKVLQHNNQSVVFTLAILSHLTLVHCLKYLRSIPKPSEAIKHQSSDVITLRHTTRTLGQIATIKEIFLASRSSFSDVLHIPTLGPRRLHRTGASNADAYVSIATTDLKTKSDLSSLTAEQVNYIHHLATSPTVKEKPNWVRHSDFNGGNDSIGPTGKLEELLKACVVLPSGFVASNDWATGFYCVAFEGARIAYFLEEKDANAFRLDKINTILNRH